MMMMEPTRISILTSNASACLCDTLLVYPLSLTLPLPQQENNEAQPGLAARGTRKCLLSEFLLAYNVVMSGFFMKFKYILDNYIIHIPKYIIAHLSSFSTFE